MEKVILHKVWLTYFKATGKYYARGKYHTQKDNMLDVIEEVKTLKSLNELPGITCNDMIILLEVDSDFAFPKLIMLESEDLK
jgi:hypothetical protein